MMTNKFCTKIKTGNNVRLFTLILLAITATSCIKETNDGDPRDSITGTWACRENGSSSNFTAFETTISKATDDSTKILIDNFSGCIQVYAKLSGGSNLTIPSQTKDNIRVSGSGKISSDNKTITWNFTAIDDDTDVVTSTYTKKN